MGDALSAAAAQRKRQTPLSRRLEARQEVEAVIRRLDVQAQRLLGYDRDSQQKNSKKNAAHERLGKEDVCILTKARKDQSTL